MDTRVSVILLAINMTTKCRFSEDIESLALPSCQVYDSLTSLESNGFSNSYLVDHMFDTDPIMLS